MTTIVAIMVISMTTLGIKIKELRSLRDWTQNELAKRSGVDRGTLASIESGKAKNPTTHNLLKLASAFKIRPEELYQAAGYIKMERTVLPIEESPEEILERLRVCIASTVPIYEQFPVHAGQSVPALEHVSVVKVRAMNRSLEGYIVHGDCLGPYIHDNDIIIVDRNATPDNGDVVACLVDDAVEVGILRKIGGGFWMENNNGRVELREGQIRAVVVELRRRLK